MTIPAVSLISYVYTIATATTKKAFQRLTVKNTIDKSKFNSNIVQVIHKKSGEKIEKLKAQKEKKKKERQNKMANLSLNISIITLNANYLNIPIKYIY